MKTSQDLVTRLRAAGGKLTPQRLFLFRALEHAHNHPSAEDLYAEVRADLPTLSLGTVYKTLSELVDLGEVQTVETGDGRAHYDPNTEPHAHLHCRRCGRLDDASLDIVSVQAPSEVGGFLVTGQRVVLEGYCQHCR
jgi:Fur family transcriptional regulator, peroxide stress response regulator